MSEVSTSLADLPSGSVEATVCDYNSLLQVLADKHAPLKSREVTLRPNSLWYTEALGEEKRKRRRLERTARRTKLQVHREAFEHQRNHYNHLRDQAVTDYYRSKISEAPTARDRWSTCNSLLGKRKSNSLPEHTSEK